MIKTGRVLQMHRQAHWRVIRHTARPPELLREFEADRSGSELTGAPLNLASALDKLHAGTSRHPMEVGAAASTLFIADPYASLSAQQRQKLRFSRMFSTHPPIEERIDRLTQMASPLS